MDVFHQKTCVRFVPHIGQRDYLKIESKMGWVSGQSSCCWTDAYETGRGGRENQSLATTINWTTPPVWRSSPSPRCWSTVGRNGGQQLLSLSVSGCMDRGIIQHELLHALGFHHEHNRSDRDQHVRINWENVPEGELLLRVDSSKVSPGRPSWAAPTRGFFLLYLLLLLLSLVLGNRSGFSQQFPASWHRRAGRKASTGWS